MTGIYVRPLLSAIPLLALALWMKWFWIFGRTWLELITAAAILGITGLLLCLFTCVEPGHRIMVRDMILRKLRLGRRQAEVAV